MTTSTALAAIAWLWAAGALVTHIAVADQIAARRYPPATAKLAWVALWLFWPIGITIAVTLATIDQVRAWYKQIRSR